jgi:hypothetical protein
VPTLFSHSYGTPVRSLLKSPAWNFSTGMVSTGFMN